MARKNVSAGHVIAIRTDDGSVGVAKIIYVSTTFKHLIGLRLMRACFRRVPRSEELPSAEEYFPGVIYTGSQSVGKYWPILKQLAVTDVEIELTRRLVGDSVYVGDDNLGVASGGDLKSLRSMGVLNRYGTEDVLGEKLKTLC